jgi:hypothetical protein
MKNTLEPIAQELLERYDKGGISPSGLAKEYGASQSGMRQFLTKHGRDTSRLFGNNVKPMSNTEVAYLAGLIDGEGCLYARKTISRKTIGVASGLIISMTDGGVIQEMQSMTGVGGIALFKDKRKTNWKVAHIWTVGSQQCALLCREVLPYLRIKKRQAELLIELAELKRKSTTRHAYCPERQWEIVKEVQLLNQRGV